MSDYVKNIQELFSWIIIIAMIFAFIALIFANHKTNLDNILFITEPRSLSNITWKGEQQTNDSNKIQDEMNEVIEEVQMSLLKSDLADIYHKPKQYTISTWLFILPSSDQGNIATNKAILMRGDMQPAIVYNHFDDTIRIIVSGVDEGESGTKKTNSSLTTWSINNINIARWFNLTLVVNNTIVEVYINGKLVRTIIDKAYAFTNVTTDHKLSSIWTFGAHNDIQGMNGKIARTRYYGRALHYNELLENYKMGVDSLMDTTKALIYNTTDYINKSSKHYEHILSTDMSTFMNESDNILGKAEEKTAKVLSKTETLMRDIGGYALDSTETVSSKLGLDGATSFMTDVGHRAMYGKDYKDNINYITNVGIDSSCLSKDYAKKAGVIDFGSHKLVKKGCRTACDCIGDEYCNKGKCTIPDYSYELDTSQTNTNALQINNNTDLTDAAIEPDNKVTAIDTALLHNDYTCSKKANQGNEEGGFIWNEFTKKCFKISKDNLENIQSNNQYIHKYKYNKNTPTEIKQINDDNNEYRLKRL